MATTRGKFKVQSVTDYGHGKEMVLNAVCNDGTPENDRFHRYTPTGQIKMLVDNPAASAMFKPGVEFYVDFTPAVPAEPATSPA